MSASIFKSGLKPGISETISPSSNFELTFNKFNFLIAKSTSISFPMRLLTLAGLVFIIFSSLLPLTTSENSNSSKPKVFKRYNALKIAVLAIVGSSFFWNLVLASLFISRRLPVFLI